MDRPPLAAAPRLAVPQLRFRDGGGLLYSTLARLIASGTAAHRAELVATAGLARSTVTRHLDALIAAGVVVEGGVLERPGRGRPPLRLTLNPRAGVVAVADLGAHSARLRIADLSQQVLARTEFPVALTDGPDAVLARLAEEFRTLLERTGLPDAALCTAAVGVPGPVDHAAGAPVRPPIMPGWDGHPVAETLAGHLGCPVLVDNDVNLMALGEARMLPADQAPLLYIKVGTGIGGGFVSADGELHRGADGAAGDIGHLTVPGAEGPECPCGKAGCVEAVASTRAMRARLSEARGPEADLVELARRGDPDALRVVRAAATPIGEVVALLVHVLNPARIVIGGAVADAGDDLIAGIRSVVYRRALPLATRALTLGPSLLGPDAAGLGGGVLAVEHALSPDGITGLMTPAR
ncbi:ROK family protein [Streptomyces sp. VRA16 Mangrove soil]|uniref:ROK family transcriptional regulator n=1 Tax=Streptomyces sp. VRA16 Mangrove soil TaxID=2817434 RepID=UPI001A9FDEA6|nr:ROK family protein [Streptomyces sp. VRA16 Mangrove soil]MBO1334563.1 ROK family protein [Streptomyces sp. VRA16 Mangrove soil]